MQIDPKKCVACGNCVAVCPMGAIYIDPAVNRATVNTEECVECYTCHRGMSMERLNPVLVRAVRRMLHVFRLLLQKPVTVYRDVAGLAELLRSRLQNRRAPRQPISSGAMSPSARRFYPTLRRK